MFTKEDIVPAGADRMLHTLAPFFSVFFALVAFAGIPFGDRRHLGDRVIELQVAKIDAALLYIFAMLSLGVYGVILAGFASRNNYAILGGLRATAQMISYEIALGIAVVGVIMVYGTLDLPELVRGQGQMMAAAGFPSGESSPSRWPSSSSSPRPWLKPSGFRSICPKASRRSSGTSSNTAE